LTTTTFFGLQVVIVR